MTIDRPVRRAGLGEQVAWDLRLRIFGRHLPGGAHLVEDQLAADYGVSRGPVRDAIRELEAEGLLEALGKRGFFVVEQTDADIEELLSLRTSIETLGTVAAMRAAEPEDWDLLSRCVAAMDGAATRGDHADFTRADMAFHDAIYRVSRHRRFTHVWNLYQKTFTAILQLANSDDVDARLAVESHSELVRRMREGDEDRVRLMVGEYIQGSRQHFAAAVTQPSPAGTTVHRASA